MSMMSDHLAADPATSSGPHQAARLPFVALLMAGAMVGLALILWLAANWAEFGKIDRFAVVGAAILAAATAGIVSPLIRAPAALAGVLAIGGLFALFGQVYQSSADAYELFAIWAVVALPWVIAARHDAVWALWVVIVFTALPLWLGVAVSPAAQHTSDVVSVWAIACLVSLALSPWSRLDGILGETRWAFRLAVILTLGLVVSYTAIAIFGARSESALLPFLGYALVIAAIAAFAILPPFSLALLAAAALAFDVLAICTLSKMMLHSGSLQGGLLFLGLISAALIAGSAVAVLRVARAKNGGTLQNDHVVPGALTRISTWPVSLLSGVGAVFAAVPLFVYLGLTFGSMLVKGSSSYMIGAIIMAASVAGMYKAAAISFRQQLAYIGLVTGFAVLSYSLFRDTAPTSATFVLLMLCIGLSAAISVRWISVLLGNAAAGFAAAHIWLQLYSFVTPAGFTFKNLAAIFAAPRGYNELILTYLIVAVIGALAFVAFHGIRQASANSETRSGTTSADIREWLDRAEGFMTGWCASLLAALMIGNPTFLLANSWRSFNHLTQQAVPLDLALSPAKVAAVVIVAAAIAYLVSRRPDWRSVPGFAIGAAFVVLAYVSPTIAAAFAIFAAALATSRHRLAMLAAFALIWLVGSFYYWLGWPLLTKAYLLGSVGLALGAIILIAVDDALPHQKAHQSAKPSGSRRTSGSAERLAPLASGALTLLAVLATAASVGAGIWQKEAIIENGRRVFIALAPVDPRSLIRGDYMALRFKTAALPRAEQLNAACRSGPSRRSTQTALPTLKASPPARINSRQTASPFASSFKSVRSSSAPTPSSFRKARLKNTAAPDMANSASAPPANPFSSVWPTRI